MEKTETKNRVSLVINLATWYIELVYGKSMGKIESVRKESLIFTDPA